MFSGREIVKNSYLHVVGRQLFQLPDAQSASELGDASKTGRRPAPYGVLDSRLGGDGGSREAVGRFGHIKLALPVFHIGFFKETISLLQCICKVCSRVLLPLDLRRQFLQRLHRNRHDSIVMGRVRHAMLL